MAIEGDKFIMFFDVVALQKEGFVQNSGHGYDLFNNIKLMTKLEVADVWRIDTTTPEWVELTDDQWVARWRMTPGYDVPPPDPLPSIPILTTTYPPPQNTDFNQCVLHEWTLSTPDVIDYQIQTFDHNGNYVTAATYPVEVFPDREAIQCLGIPRNCKQFSFQINARNLVGNSGWSARTYATLKTEFPFFTNFYTYGSVTGVPLLWQYTGAYPAGIPTQSLTNDGRRYYQIQDNGNITCNIYSSPLTVAHKTETIDPSILHHQEDVYTRWNCYSGFISDDGKDALFITREVNNVISHSTSTTGWAASMNFTRQLGVNLSIGGDAQCIKMNLDYTKVFMCKGAIIYQFSMNAPWDIATMTVTDTIDLTVPDLLLGFTFRDVEDYSFVNSGFGIVVRSRIAVEGQNDMAAVHYIELPTAFSLANPIFHMIDGGSFAKSGGGGVNTRIAYPVFSTSADPRCDEFCYITSYNDNSNYKFNSDRSK